MKTKVSPSIVGAFVIGAFALCTLALLSFGGIHIFEKPERFVVFFDESISGLDLGSPVKLRGVRVGRVVNLNVRYDQATNSSLVAVVCEFSKDMVTGPNGAMIDISSRAELEKLVQRGLHAQVAVLGLATGLLFVELNFKAPEELAIEHLPKDDRYVVVPSIRSPIEEFSAGLSEILANLKKVDLAGVAKDISALANTARKQVDGVDFRGLTEQWKKTGAQFETLAGDPQIKQTFVNVNAAVADLRAMVAKLDAQVEPTSKEFAATMAEAKKTLATFNATAASAQAFINTHGGLGEEVAGTLAQLNEAADAVKRLADFLERNPNALITGRKRPE